MNGKQNINLNNRGMRDEELVQAMLALRDADPESFFDLVFNAMKINRDAAINDKADKEQKLKALQTVLDFFEGTEAYERCGFIHDMMKEIENG